MRVGVWMFCRHKYTHTHTYTHSHMYTHSHAHTKLSSPFPFFLPRPLFLLVQDSTCSALEDVESEILKCSTRKIPLHCSLRKKLLPAMQVHMHEDTIRVQCGAKNT